MLFLKAFFLLHILDMSQQTTICPFVQIDQFLLISNFNSYKELNFTNCPVANILSLEIIVDTIFVIVELVPINVPLVIIKSPYICELPITSN